MTYRYLGNKKRIADWIATAVKARVGTGLTIADLMCGTATMSEAFAREGLNVVAADELLFPVLHARARLLFDGAYTFEPVAASYADALAELNRLRPRRGLFWREYSDQGRPRNGSRPRRYFTGGNAGKIDAIRSRIRQWRAAGLASAAGDLLLHDLILAINKVANIAGTYGYYRASWNPSSLHALELTASAPRKHIGSHGVLHGKVETIAGDIVADAFYLDPPYTKRQYGGNYHIPETIAQEDEPTPVGDGGLRDWSNQASAFCYKRTAQAAFRSTLDRIRAPWVFVSYSEDGQVSPEDLYRLLSDYGSVCRHEIPIERFRSNDRTRTSPVHEHLYMLETGRAR